MNKINAYLKKNSARIIMSVVGVIILGISVGFFKAAAFGVDPFQTLMSGLDALIPMGYGTLYVVFNALLLIFTLVFDRHKAGLATILNLLFLGYIIEFCLNLLLGLFPNPSVVLRVFYLLTAVVLNCGASAMYYVADLGVSTYDAIALILSEKKHVLPFRFMRIVTDFVCVLIGTVIYYFCGHTLLECTEIAGIGTIISMFCTGPLIELFKTHMAQPMYESLCRKLKN